MCTGVARRRDGNQHPTGLWFRVRDHERRADMSVVPDATVTVNRGVIKSLFVTKSGTLRLAGIVTSIGIIHLSMDGPWRRQKARPPRPILPAVVSLVALERW